MAYPGFVGTCRMGQHRRTQGLEVHVGWAQDAWRSKFTCSGVQRQTL